MLGRPIHTATPRQDAEMAAIMEVETTGYSGWSFVTCRIYLSSKNFENRIGFVYWSRFGI